MKQEAIIIHGKEQRREGMKIVGFPNYPKFIFKKLLERELIEKRKYGFVLHPVFKKQNYDIKVCKTKIPSVSKSFFIVNDDGISLFFDWDGSTIFSWNPNESKKELIK